MKNSHFDNIIKNNPVLVQGLGIVSVLAVSRTFKGALIMSLAVLGVFIASSIVVSALKSLIDDEYEMVSISVIAALFSFIAYMLINAFFPITTGSMGIYAFLIAVNSMILNRLQKYAKYETIGNSIMDAFTNSLGYAVVIAILGFIRELIGAGTLFGERIIPEAYIIKTFQEPVFAFILLGIFMAIGNSFTTKVKEEAK